MQESIYLPTEFGITIILYCTKIHPLLKYASPVWGGLPKYLAEELQSIQNRCLGIIGIPRTPHPTLEDRYKVVTKRELERIVDDVNHPNQIFLTRPNTSHGYNLRSIPGSVAMYTKVRNAKTYELVFSKSCKTPPFMICIFLLAVPLLEIHLCMLFLKLDK